VREREKEAERVCGERTEGGL